MQRATPLAGARVALTERMRKFTVLTERFGWKGAVRTAALWALRRICGYRAAVIYCLDLSELSGLEVRESLEWSYKGALDLAPALRSATGFSPESLEQATAMGARFFVGTDKGMQCYFSRVSDRGFLIPGRVSVEFCGELEAYVGDCLTLDAYRGRGIYPCGLRELGYRLRSEGRRRLYLYVERENLASMRSVEKAGFRRLAVCTVFRWGNSLKQRWRDLPSAGARDAACRWKIDFVSPADHPAAKFSSTARRS